MTVAAFHGMRPEQEIKDYLGEENLRNKMHAPLFVRMLKEAWGPNYDVLIGHHICYQQHGNIDTENEIPAADTLLFDHDIMTKLFGDRAVCVMRELATLKPGEREKKVEQLLQTGCNV